MGTTKPPLWGVGPNERTFSGQGDTRPKPSFGGWRRVSPCPLRVYGSKITEADETEMIE